MSHQMSRAHDATIVDQMIPSPVHRAPPALGYCPLEELDVRPGIGASLVHRPRACFRRLDQVEPSRGVLIGELTPLMSPSIGGQRDVCGLVRAKLNGR
jgi:hypothetical protein